MGDAMRDMTHNRRKVTGCQQLVHRQASKIKPPCCVIFYQKHAAKRKMYNIGAFLFLSMHFFSIVPWVYGNDCRGGEIVIMSDTNKSGTISSPFWPQSYLPSTRCVYRFEGKANERVQIKFHDFNIEGLGPNCQKDFLDIYIEMRDSKQPLEKSTLLGRYCGHYLTRVPNNLISRYNVLLLDLFSDHNTQNDYYKDSHNRRPLGFSATYSFINEARFVFGSHIDAETDCSYSIESNRQQSNNGSVSSPTYPGLQPDHLNCSIVFRGQAGQRVRIRFLDFDLHRLRGYEEHVMFCPVEKVRILDGESSNSPLIGEFCASQEELQFFSSGTSLRLEWINMGGRIQPDILNVIENAEELQRRGYKAEYEFSEGFVQITDKKSHILGTECDKWIKSEGQGQSVGYISSPGYIEGSTQNYPLNRVCTYYLYGFHSEQDRERVELHFNILNIPQEGGATNTKCSKGQLRVYLNGQNKLNDNPDEILCGNHSKAIVSKGSQLVLVFDTSLATEKGLGFEASFAFKVDFGIEGKMERPGACEYVYHSSQYNEGIISSPFFPRKYPLNITCQYTFLPQPSDFIRIQFEKFYVAKDDEDSTDEFVKTHHSVGMQCTADYVEIQELLPNPISKVEEIRSTLRYCGFSIPGPIVSDERTTRLVLIFHSNKVRSTTGFLARFDYVDKKSVSQNCGTVEQLNNPLKRGGIVVSPNFPKRYPKNIVCEWQIHRSHNLNQLMLQFPMFKLEGAARSCAMAIVRIYDGDQVKPDSEICGTDINIKSFIKSTSHLRIRLLVAKHPNQAVGFKISWTEILKNYAKGTCQGFLCRNTNYCIDYSLECNNETNCGTYVDDKKKELTDVSDETLHSSKCGNKTSRAGSEPDKYNLLHVGVGIFLTLLLLIAIVIGILYKEQRKNNLKKFHNGHSCAATPSGTTFNAADMQALRELMYERQAMEDVDNQCDDYSIRGGHTSKYSDSQFLETISHSGGTLTREKMQKISIV